MLALAKMTANLPGFDDLRAQALTDLVKKSIMQERNQPDNNVVDLGVER